MQTIIRPIYSASIVENGTLTEGADFPTGFTIDALEDSGTITWSYLWEEAPAFTGKPIYVLIEEATEGSYVIFTGSVTLADAIITQEAYRFAFEYYARITEEQEQPDLENCYFDVKFDFYDESDVLVGSTVIQQPFSPGLIQAGMELTIPKDTKRIGLSLIFSTACAYQFGNLLLNKKTGIDSFSLAEDTLPETLDKIMACYDSEVYAIDTMSLLLATNLALGTEVDIIVALTKTVMNYFFLAYASQDRLDSFGLLVARPRYAGEYDDAYRTRLQNTLKTYLGAGTATTIREVLARYMRGPEPIINELWLPGSGIEVIIPENAEVQLTDEQLINVLKEIVMVGTYIQIVSVGSAKWDEGYGIDVDEWN
jgi:hypothetical protein